MRTLICATTNKQKFSLAKECFASRNIELVQQELDIDEIQGEDPEIIIRDKVTKAFQSAGKPVIVTDDSWSILGLNGFPGPYMKSMNHWFTPEDFLRLANNLTDRHIILHQYVAFHDGAQTKVFHNDAPGMLATTARGTFGPPFSKIAALTRDAGLTISEVYDAHDGSYPASATDEDDAWNLAAKWYNEQIK